MLPVSGGGRSTDATLSTFRKLDERRNSSAGVLVHCASGNRIGGAMIPWLVLDRGWDLERAVRAAKTGGMRSPELEAGARDYVARMRTAR